MKIPDSVATDVMTALWAIKGATAKRFHNPHDDFVHLSPAQPKQNSAKRAKLANRAA
jgi:hypothetical protein